MPGESWNNIENYLRFRGDISFDESPFNDVDNLVLAAFSYTDLTGLANVSECESGLKLSEFARRLKKKGCYTKKEDILAKLDFVYLLAGTKRFGGLLISHFVDDVSFDGGFQFSAMEISLGNGLAYIAYRGTDDSPAGWKEDFTLTFLEVPGQKKALRYLKSSLLRYDKVYVGGHSKGGNLALYACSFLNEAENEKVEKIYLNDSPGLCHKVKERATSGRIGDKVIRIQPSFSVVGELLEPGANEVKIVSSYANDIIQHDPFTWEVSGTEFVEAKDFDPNAKSLAQALSFWLDSLDDEEKKKTIDDMFASIHQYPSISSWREKGMREILKAIYSFVRKNSDINSLMLLPLAALGTEKTRPVFKTLVEFLTRNSLPIGALLLVFGTLCVFFPAVSMSVLSIAIVGLTTAFEIFITVYLTIQEKGDVEPQLFRAYAATMLLIIFLGMICNKSILEVYRSFIFGIMIQMLGFREIGEIFRYKPRLMTSILKAILATFLIVSGGFMLIDTTHELAFTKILLATVAWAFGIIYSVQGIWSLEKKRRAKNAYR